VLSTIDIGIYSISHFICCILLNVYLCWLIFIVVMEKIKGSIFSETQCRLMHSVVPNLNESVYVI